MKTLRTMVIAIVAAMVLLAPWWLLSEHLRQAREQLSQQATKLEQLETIRSDLIERIERIDRRSNKTVIIHATTVERGPPGPPGPAGPPAPAPSEIPTPAPLPEPPGEPDDPLCGTLGLFCTAPTVAGVGLTALYILRRPMN